MAQNPADALTALLGLRTPVWAEPRPGTPADLVRKLRALPREAGESAIAAGVGGLIPLPEDVPAMASTVGAVLMTLFGRGDDPRTVEANRQLDALLASTRQVVSEPRKFPVELVALAGMLRMPPKVWWTGRVGAGGVPLLAAEAPLVRAPPMSGIRPKWWLGEQKEWLVKAGTWGSEMEHYAGIARRTPTERHRFLQPRSEFGFKDPLGNRWVVTTQPRVPLSEEPYHLWQQASNTTRDLFRELGIGDFHSGQFALTPQGKPVIFDYELPGSGGVGPIVSDVMYRLQRERDLVELGRDVARKGPPSSEAATAAVQTRFGYDPDYDAGALADATARVFEHARRIYDRHESALQLLEQFDLTP